MPEFEDIEDALFDDDDECIELAPMKHCSPEQGWSEIEYDSRGEPRD